MNARPVLAACLLASLVVLAGCIDLRLATPFFNYSYSGNAELDVSIPAPQLRAQTPIAPPSELWACVHGQPNAALERALGESVPIGNAAVPVSVAWLPPAFTAEDVRPCDLLVIASDAQGQLLSFAQRTAVREHVERGANLILERRAGAFAPDDNAVAGWDLGLAGIVPARVAALANDGTLFEETAWTGFLVFKTREGGAWADQAVDNVRVQRTVPVDGAETVAVIRTLPEETSPSIPALVRRTVPAPQGATLSTTYYFAFNPLDRPALFTDVAQRLLVDAATKIRVTVS